MCSKQVRRDPYCALSHQTTQNGTLTKSGLLKSGNLVKRRTPVRGDPKMRSLSSMMIWTLTPPQNRTFLWNLVHSWIEWMFDCERCWTVHQKIQCKTLTNVLWFGECLCLRHWKHLYSWARITQTICIPSKIQVKISLTFVISEKLILEQSGEIFGVSQICWEDSSWKQVSLLNDEEVISLSHAKVHVFSDSVLCLGIMNENPQSNITWEDRLMWFKSSSECRALDRIDGEPMEFEWNIFPGFNTLQLSHKVQELLSRLSVAREMGSTRHALNRRRRTREGPEPACVQTPFNLGSGTCKGWRMN